MKRHREKNVVAMKLAESTQSKDFSREKTVAPWFLFTVVFVSHLNETKRIN